MLYVHRPGLQFISKSIVNNFILTGFRKLTESIITDKQTTSNTVGFRTRAYLYKFKLFYFPLFSIIEQVSVSSTIMTMSKRGLERYMHPINIIISEIFMRSMWPIFSADWVNLKPVLDRVCNKRIFKWIWYDDVLLNNWTSYGVYLILN